jgi:predicted RNase H-like nuclease (RuvC/YqgF family)
MSEENNVEVEVDYKALADSLKAELDKTKKHNEELFSETKAAKKAREQEVAEKQRIEKERAQKDGEFEKLWQSAEEQRKTLEQELQKERNQYKQEKIQSHAMKIAVELADGDALSAKLLSKFLTESISKMADEKGTLDENVLVAVKKEFQNNTDYAPLLSGSKATGGGALGSGNGVAKQNHTIDRSSFNNMNPAQQKDFIIAKKGVVTD